MNKNIKMLDYINFSIYLVVYGLFVRVVKKY